MDDHAHFMGLAVEEAQTALDEGNPPFGSVIVCGGKIVGRAHNTVVTGTDVTAHAETEAIRDACRNLRTTDLKGATCYTSMEPCPMCLWAIVLSGLTRLVIGGRFDECLALRGRWSG